MLEDVYNNKTEKGLFHSMFICSEKLSFDEEHRPKAYTDNFSSREMLVDFSNGVEEGRTESFNATR